MKFSKWELIFLGLCLLIGSFLRLYSIDKTAMFLGDQGRDAIIAKNILVNHDIALIGPVTSVGNMYLGPFYYYFMVPWLWMSYPDPLGPAVGVAITGIITIGLVYIITKKMFSVPQAVFATTLFTVSQIAVSQVRFSWNPNIAPTVGLLIFYCAYLVWVKKKHANILWLAVLFSIITQLHYMALLLAGFIGLTALATFVRDANARVKIASLSVVGIIIFLTSLAPLIVFDTRHDGLISQGFGKFFTSNEEHILPTSKIMAVLANFSGNLFKLLPQMVGSRTQVVHFSLMAIIVFIAWYIYKRSDKSKRQTLQLFFIWFGFAALAMSAYTSSIFIHYISFSQATSLMFLGILLGGVYLVSGRLAKIILVITISAFVVSNIKNSPAFEYGQSNAKVAQITAESIYQRVKDAEKYNIVLISGTGDIDAQNYRYFLETTKRPPVKIENRGEIETLFIIQEDYFGKKVIDSPIYEIVVFPDKNPKEVYTIQDGPTVTVLKVQSNE